MKSILGGEGEKVVKEINLTTITLIHEKFFLYDLENYICKTYVTEIEKSFSLYGLVFFSGKAIKDKAVSLILLQNKLKFNVERDILKKELSLEFEKLNEKSAIFTSRDNFFKLWNIMHPKK